MLDVLEKLLNLDNEQRYKVFKLIKICDINFKIPYDFMSMPLFLVQIIDIYIDYLNSRHIVLSDDDFQKELNKI